MITIERKILLAGVRAAAGAIAGRATLPVLECLLLEETEAGLRLRGTNLDMELSLLIPVEDGQELRAAGEGMCICVPAKRLAGMLGAMEEEMVALTTDHSAGYAQLGLRCGEAVAKLICLEGEEYPPEHVMDVAEKTSTAIQCRAFSMEAAELHRVLGLAVKYASTDETRYVLNGVLLKVEAGVVRVVGTDGRRLMTVEERREDSGSEMEDRKGLKYGELGILPRAAVGLLLGLLRGHDAVLVTAGARMLEVTAGRWVVRTKWIDGAYPNWRQVVPEPKCWLAGIDSPRLQAMVERAVVVASAGGANCTVRLGLQKSGMVEVSALHPDIGDYRESAPLAQKGPKKEMTLSFNAVYLLGMLLPGDDVEWGVIDGVSPLVVRSHKQGVMAVVMPMRATDGEGEEEKREDGGSKMEKKK